jgi:hypothetical protein
MYVVIISNDSMYVVIISNARSRRVGLPNMNYSQLNIRPSHVFLEKTFLSCETCVLSNCFLLHNKICLK